MNIYAWCMNRWERKLAGRDKNRVEREFDWGLEWLQVEPNGSAGAALEQYVAGVLSRSGEFFSYATPLDFQLSGNALRFTSAVRSPYPENNTVSALYLPAGTDRAVVVLPQWNADAQAHTGLCRLLNRFGFSALRLTLAYHAARCPAGMERAEYHVSSNLGRTIHACRQSVIDARSCVDWLVEAGYRRIGIVGTSLGSCIAFMAAAHDARIGAGVFNHISLYFSDVVWTGLSTQHVQRSLEGVITQEQLRRYWAPISPASYLDRLAAGTLQSLLIWGRHDSTFLPELSQQVLDAFRSRGLAHEAFCLPCGHYTTGQFPFNWIDGLVICRYLERNL